MTNNNRVEVLARRLEEAVETVLGIAQECTREQWEMIVEVENRSVGLLFHHLAYPFPLQTGWVMTVAEGNEVRGYTREEVDDFNRRHAEEFAQVTKEETIDLMRRNCGDALAKLRTLTDEQLTLTTPLRFPYLSQHHGPELTTLLDGSEISAQQIMEWQMITHCYEHLQQIKNTLGIE